MRFLRHEPALLMALLVKETNRRAIAQLTTDVTTGEASVRGGTA